MTWEFVTKPVRTTHSVAWEWAWRFRAEDGSTTTSERTFASFWECTADARLHGFTGEAEPGQSGTLFQRPEARFTWY